MLDVDVDLVVASGHRGHDAAVFGCRLGRPLGKVCPDRRRCLGRVPVEQPDALGVEVDRPNSVAGATAALDRLLDHRARRELGRLQPDERFLLRLAHVAHHDRRQAAGLPRFHAQCLRGGRADQATPRQRECAREPSQREDDVQRRRGAAHRCPTNLTRQHPQNSAVSCRALEAQHHGIRARPLPRNGDGLGGDAGARGRDITCMLAHVGRPAVRRIGSDHASG